MARRYTAMRKVNMFTTVQGKDVPILEEIKGTYAFDIPSCADKLNQLYANIPFPEDGSIVIVETEHS